MACGLIYAAALGSDVNIGITVRVLIGLLFVILGSYMPKCRKTLGAWRTFSYGICVCGCENRTVRIPSADIHYGICPDGILLHLLQKAKEIMRRLSYQ